MKLFWKSLSVLLAAFICLSVSAQKVDSVMLNGEQVYVYPFKIDVKQSEYYLMAVDGGTMMSSIFVYEDIVEEQRASGVPDSLRMTREDFDLFLKALNAKNYKKFKKYYLPKFGPIPSKSEFNQYAKFRDNGMDVLGMGSEVKIFKSKKFKKAVRANPYPFLSQRQDMDQDIVPMLDPIPDGKYIQYYESFCWVQEDGSCEFISDQIAGYFTIKNNILNGEATWVNLAGDTLKHGLFEDGLKTGEWYLMREEISFFGQSHAENFVETGEVPVNREEMYTTFNQGVMEGAYRRTNGEGYALETGEYKDGEATGEWTIHWNYLNEEEASESKQFPIRKHYTINENDSLIVRPFLIRSGLFDVWEYENEDHDFYAYYDFPELPNLYRPAFPEEENFELEEEIFDDNFSEVEYMGDVYYEEDHYDDFSFGSLSNWGMSYFETRIHDPNNGERLERGKVFDSIGACPYYSDVYEVFHANGQLAFRYELEDGLLKEEPTIYWDNGNVYDEITFDKDSNVYIRKIYDYNGKEFKTIMYDSSGYFKYSGDLYDRAEQMEIDGLKFYPSEYSNSFHYVMPDSVLEFVSEPKSVLERRWHKINKSVLEEHFFDPNSRTSNYYAYNLFGDTLVRSERIFAEGYDSWTGSISQEAGPFEIRGVRSASLFEWSEVDSIPVLMTNAYRTFDVDSDYELFYENELLTGPMEFTFKGETFKFKKGAVNIPENKDEWQKFDQAIILYRLTKGKKRLNKKYTNIAKVIESERLNYRDFTKVFSDVFDPLFSHSWNIRDSYYGEYYWEDEFGRDVGSSPEKIEGYFLNGKPEGIWKSYDEYGNVLVEANYEKGMLNGTMRMYAYEYPIEEDDLYYYYDEDHDSLPDTRTYYLYGEYNYKNNLKDGKSYEYNWYGMPTLEEDYKDGYLEGLSIERNELAISISEFKDGYRDGYSRTYLTLPDKDSILLFDLNFQNGALQGESVAYHTNGKIAKRGFFLQGEPIEDYEGYDSLGFKYHYVTFEYGFPVEEKLWEENELSVRYTFNWEDSIPFVPMNLTDSESLDALLVKAGLSGGFEYRPYYGREAIVDKQGVDYHLTKYFPNDTISRDGDIVKGKKSGHWEFFSYDGEKLYEVNYFDTLLVVNDSIKFNAKGIYTDLDSTGNELFRAYIIEKSERFDCSHKDHYEVRQFYTISEVNDSLGRMNGEVVNFYDNGTLQSYGKMKDGLPDGEWRYYDPAGKLNKYGSYVQGKRNGRWLSGDLSKTKYLGDICLNPNMPDVEETIRFRRNFLDIQIINYRLGQQKATEYYDINMNRFIEYDEEEEEMEEVIIEEE